MTESGAAVLSEERLPGEVPRWEIPGWRSEFGIVAGVTGRGPVGGIDFDLGLRTNQPVGPTMERWDRFLSVEPGFSGAVLGRQVHGTEVMDHPRGYPGWLQVEGVDGHSTRVPGLLLLVTVADCVPIYLLDRVSHAAVLLHGGWRGIAEGILEAGLERLTGVYGASVDNIVMHCGVAISGSCYEVGNEVTDRFGISPGSSGRQNFDLRSELVRRARRLGFGRVTASGRCTAQEADDFFSHRRSGGRDGRQVAYLGIPDPVVQSQGEI